MRWVQQASKISEHMEWLQHEGLFVGYIIKFSGDPRTFGWTSKIKVGEYPNIGEAKDGIEALVTATKRKKK